VLVEPICQASIRRAPGAILFSNPAEENVRKEMTLRASCDEGRTWPAAKVLWPGPAAYSCLAVRPDGTILCLYERGVKRPYETITLAEIPPEWLLERTASPAEASARTASIGCCECCALPPTPSGQQ
jgi:sialidase-1